MSLVFLAGEKKYGTLSRIETKNPGGLRTNSIDGY
jgi:hypothetical protein